MVRDALAASGCAATAPKHIRPIQVLLDLKA